ncbi:DUF6328 family protein [Sciscionella marina]|uniref:DUF6328 family protein n=1 Tax=Sciscionella marina TaxID=508770 RepID=UPI000368F682
MDLLTTEEAHQQRLTRNVNELLQELRVAQAGVQILFGFLLAVAFTDTDARAGTDIHTIHVVTVMLTTFSTALLIAPAAWHRMLFRRGQRARIVRVANRCAVAGLGFPAAAMTGTVLLLTKIVLGGTPAILLTAATATIFTILWFATPLQCRCSVAEATPVDERDRRPKDGSESGKV